MFVGRQYINIRHIYTMTLQNLQQCGCQTGNKLKEKSIKIKMKQCSVADTKTVRSLEF
jgi:hypothetical protein